MRLTGMQRNIPPNKQSFTHSPIFVSGEAVANLVGANLSYSPLKYGSFWINIARAASLVARDFLIVSFQTPPGNRYEGFCYASDCNIKDDVGKVVTQDVSFQLTDEFFNS